MKKIEQYFKKKIEKHSRKFILFISIGLFKTFFSILLSWWFIDILKIRALLGSTMVVAIVFFTTYFTYVTARLIKKEFLKYTGATILFNILSIVLIWFFVDIVKFSGLISSAIVIGTLFIVRYAFFNKVGLIRYS